MIAQQVITIQLATQAAKKNFTFEGCDIALDCTSAVFITMNVRNYLPNIANFGIEYFHDADSKSRRVLFYLDRP